MTLPAADMQHIQSTQPITPTSTLPGCEAPACVAAFLASNPPEASVAMGAGALSAYERLDADGIAVYVREGRIWKPGIQAVVSIGVYDGFHKGHQALIRETKRAARARRLPSCVITFNPDPADVLRTAARTSDGTHVPSATEAASAIAVEHTHLMSLAARLEYVARTQVDFIIVIPFTWDFARLSYEEFFSFVQTKLAFPYELHVGSNFRLGYKGAGTIAALSEYGKTIGMDVHPFALVNTGVAAAAGADEPDLCTVFKPSTNALAIDAPSTSPELYALGASAPAPEPSTTRSTSSISKPSTRALPVTTISSTYIRKLIAKGHVLCAARALTRPYCLEGTVMHGRGKGASMGFATANILTRPDVCVPAAGVYAGFVLADGVLYPAAINMGLPESFSSQAYCALHASNVALRGFLEAHLIDFDGNLYGRVVSVMVIAYIRSEQHFSSTDELSRCVKANIAAIKTLLGGARKVG